MMVMMIMLPAVHDRTPIGIPGIQQYLKDTGWYTTQQTNRTNIHALLYCCTTVNNEIIIIVIWYIRIPGINNLVNLSVYFLTKQQQVKNK